MVMHRSPSLSWILFVGFCQVFFAVSYTPFPATRQQSTARGVQQRLFMTQKSSSQEEIRKKEEVSIQEDFAVGSAKTSATVPQSLAPLRLESLPLVSAVLTSSEESVSDPWKDFAAAKNVPSSPDEALMGTIIGTEKPQGRPVTTAIPAVILNSVLLLAAATYALTAGLLWMLYQFEWFQSWRYVWPLLGGVYAIDSATVLLDLVDNDKKETPSFLLAPSLSAGPGTSVLETAGALATTALTGIAGVGLVIGGAYDVFMPVWMTGPNVFTAAGIGQDSAMILLGLTSLSAVPIITSWQPTNSTHNAGLFWRYALLLSQLYILSDSAIDDVLSGLSSALVTV